MDEKYYLVDTKTMEFLCLQTVGEFITIGLRDKNGSWRLVFHPENQSPLSGQILQDVYGERSIGREISREEKTMILFEAGGTHEA